MVVWFYIYIFHVLGIFWCIILNIDLNFSIGCAYVLLHNFSFSIWINFLYKIIFSKDSGMIFLRSDLYYGFCLTFYLRKCALKPWVTMQTVHLSYHHLGGINWWSLVPVQHQQESPVWDAVKKETLFIVDSSIVTQHNCENSMAVE